MSIDKNAEDAVVSLVLTTSRALVGVAARSLSTLGDDVTLPQYRGLVILAARGPQGVGALAQALSIHPSNATRLCDRLARKQLIERHVSQESRREVTVAVTSAGRQLLAAVTKQRASEIRAIVRLMPVGQWPQVVGALGVFADAAGEAPDDAWKLGWT